MTGEEQRRMNELCMRIAVEQSHVQIVRLIREFKELLDAQEKRLRPPAIENTLNYSAAKPMGM
jgi:hypothetical protein